MRRLLLLVLLAACTGMPEERPQKEDGELPDAGEATVDAGRDPSDANSQFPDAGVDAGRVVEDAGGEWMDGGASSEDAGRDSRDAGHDAGAQSPDAGPAVEERPFPALGGRIDYDRSRIVRVSDNTIIRAGMTFRLSYYRNEAYRCGRTGHYTFAVAERQDLVDQAAPLWVYLHGGNVGYYDAGGVYHGDETHNDEEGFTALMTPLAAAFDSTGRTVRQNVFGRRVLDGYRFLLPAMCDHDLYGGMGTPYPDNPNPGRRDDRVEGLLATMAAIHFTARGQGDDVAAGLPGYRTTRVFLHGGSAGSVGSYHVGTAFAHNGVRLNGALMDSYALTSRHQDLFAAGCTPQNRDPLFEEARVQQKVGVFVTDPSLFLENVIGTPHALPVFDFGGDADTFCCGQVAPIPAARAAGYTNNCRYVQGVVESALRARPDPLSKVMLVAGKGHVISHVDGAHQTAIEEWLAAILATNPPAPIFP